ncbi:MAG: LptF/LptG family permease [Cyclobacteriaceae bacterium]|nr:LptF/LptG family permease [Cyclobacteriaceae bacterium SS2]
MKKIDRYILKKMLTTFVFVMVILVLIICIIDFTEKNDKFIKHEVSPKLILHYYLTFIPYFAILLTPITSFIATVFITAKMAAKTEVIAILASGVSFRRMMFPYFVGATLIAISSFFLINYVIPDGNKFRIPFELEYLNRPFYFSDRDIHFKVGEESYIYINRYNNRSDVGYSVTLEKIVEEELKEKLSATRIKWDSTSGKWTLMDWEHRVLVEEGEVLTEGRELDTLLNLSPADFKNKERLWETLTLPELNDYIELQKSRGADDVQIYQIEKYIRFMQPFTVLILCFIGLIVSAKKSRQGTGYQIALGFIIAFAFVIAFVLAKAIAEAGSMDPLLAVWIPNIVFTGVGLLLYNTVPR